MTLYNSYSNLKNTIKILCILLNFNIIFNHKTKFSFFKNYFTLRIHISLQLHSYFYIQMKRLVGERYKMNNVFPYFLLICICLQKFKKNKRKKNNYNMAFYTRATLLFYILCKPKDTWHCLLPTLWYLATKYSKIFILSQEIKRIKK